MNDEPLGNCKQCGVELRIARGEHNIGLRNRRDDAPLEG